MSRLKIFAIAGLAILAPFGAARAADVPMSLPPLVQKAPVFVEEYQSGWYLRGDLGYRWNEVDGASAVIGAQPTGTTIDDRFTVGGGAGYKSGWFRMDATLDWGPRASFASASPDYRIKVETTTLLANMYLDLGTWSGITPYIGAGAGMSWNRTSDYFSNTQLIPGIAGLKEQRWEFAWAAMGGMTYNLSPNLLLDVSYRYLNLGDAITPIASNNNQITIKEMSAQEIRVGLRYNLN
jgi:opacity protein-like surface antigen